MVFKESAFKVFGPQGFEFPTQKRNRIVQSQSSPSPSPSLFPLTLSSLLPRLSPLLHPPGIHQEFLFLQASIYGESYQQKNKLTWGFH